MSWKVKGKKVKNKVVARPAESGAIIAAVVALFAAFNVTLTPAQYQLVVAGVALIPAVLTYARDKGWL